MRLFLTLVLFAAHAAFAGEILFDGADVSAWPNTVKKTESGALSIEVGRRLFNLERFEIKPEKIIKLSGEFRYVGGSGEQPVVQLYFGFKPMSKDGAVIAAVNVNPDRNAAMTKTVAAAAKGDSTVIVKDAASWNNLSKHACLAFFARQDLSDLPNRKLSPKVKQVVSREDGTCAVELRSPLKFDVPVGTEVRVHNDSSTYIYAGSRGFSKLTADWQELSGTIKGVRVGAGSRTWWMGTTAAHVVFFANGRNQDGSVEFRNVKVEVVD